MDFVRSHLNWLYFLLGVIGGAALVSRHLPVIEITALMIVWNLVIVLPVAFLIDRTRENSQCS